MVNITAGADSGSILDARANALAHAINKTGVQSLGNPCTIAGFYLASAAGGATGVAAANARAVLATALEEYPPLINNRLMWRNRIRPPGSIAVAWSAIKALPGDAQFACSQLQ